MKKQGDRRGLNPRQLEPQRTANTYLPDEYAFRLATEGHGKARSSTAVITGCRKGPLSPRRPAIATIAAANAPGFVDGAPSDECWACRVPGIVPERAHIVAVLHGGSNDPDNFLLLCGHCHTDQPDGASREQQLDWLRRAPSFGARVDGIVSYLFSRVRSWADQTGRSAVLGSWFLSGVIEDAIVRGYAARAGYDNVHPNVVASLIESLLEYSTPFVTEAA